MTIIDYYIAALWVAFPILIFCMYVLRGNRKAPKGEFDSAQIAKAHRKKL